MCISIILLYIYSVKQIQPKLSEGKICTRKYKKKDQGKRTVERNGMRWKRFFLKILFLTKIDLSNSKYEKAEIKK
jgi:hypothetical protein